MNNNELYKLSDEPRVSVIMFKWP